MSGALKSPPIIVLLSISPYFCYCLCYVLMWSYVGCIDIYNCYVFLLDWSLDHHVVSFLISCNILYVKVYFVWCEDYYSNFLLLLFLWNIFFHPFTFSLYMSLVLNGFLLDSIYMGLVFYTYSASLCLLVGALNPFTYKVIIDIYVPIAIFLILGGWFCWSFFFSCNSWLYKFLQHLL